MQNDRISIILISLATLAFAWVLWPLFGAVFWATTLAIVFTPLYRRLLSHMPRHQNLASLIMIFSIIVLIVLPSLAIIAAVIRELSALFASIQSGEINLPQMYQQALGGLPSWAQRTAHDIGIADLASAQDGLTGMFGDMAGSIAPKALLIGQSTVSTVISVCVMLYLSFFLLRDGDKLLKRLKRAIPLTAALRDDLLAKFTLTVRATVKGDIFVAVLQGGLGGLGFWLLGIHAALLWMVLMMFLSLLPVFGAAVIWAPVAIYMMITGMVWQGIGLMVYGVLVISLIDNIARPYLVGQSAKIPDYVVLISTIGGIASFGIQGFITGPVVAAMFIAVWSTVTSLETSPST